MTLSDHKRATLAFMLGVFPAVRVFCDSRRSDVVVPSDDLKKPMLMLCYGNNLTPPITDLVADEQGIHATLSFDGVLARTLVGWEAVYAMDGYGDERIMVWQDSVPSDVDLATHDPTTPKKRPQPPQARGLGSPCRP